nr:UDP-N-acetylmuramate dehydrogenase [bacterium]
MDKIRAFTRGRSQAMAEGRLLMGVPMSRHTTFGIGGPADCMYLPNGAEDTLHALQDARAMGLAVTLIGNGSNLLVRDGGIEGLVIKIAAPMSRVEASGHDGWIAQGGISLARLSAVACQMGLGGLAFASGIPGALGGGLCMNAGAYGGTLSDVVEAVRIVGDDGLRWVEASRLHFAYRHSEIPRLGIAVEARLKLHPAPVEEIRCQMADLAKRRREKQPLAYKSAGSYFKRPEGDYAARLIEAAGLKGLTVGGAQVSGLHAGFVINLGGATAGDVLALEKQIVSRVEQQFGIRLEREVRVIGRE